MCLLICGGVIPASKYKSSKFVGFRHTIIGTITVDTQASFISVSSKCACIDLAQTGAVFSEN